MVPKSKATFDSVPELPRCPEDHYWDGFKKRLWIQVDCKGVADILNGDAQLKGTHLEPVFRRCTKSMVRLFANGWYPRRDIDNLIHWYKREYNPVADHLVNAAMDSNSDWQWQDDSQLSVTGSYKICVDGGLRGVPGQHMRPSALGCAVFRILPQSNDPCPKFIPVFLAACLVESVSSAFQAETMALEWSLSLFESLFPM